MRQRLRLPALCSKALPVPRENPPVLILSLLHVPKAHKPKAWPHAIGTSISRKSSFFLHPGSSLSLARTTPQWLLTSCLPASLLVAGTWQMPNEQRKGVSGRAGAALSFSRTDQSVYICSSVLLCLETQFSWPELFLWHLKSRRSLLGGNWCPLPPLVWEAVGSVQIWGLWHCPVWPSEVVRRELSHHIFIFC